MIRRQRTRPGIEAPVETTSIAARRLKRASPAAAEEPKKATAMIVKLPGMYRSPMSDVISRVAWDMQPTRSGHHLHVSDLLSKCIRKRAIAAHLGTKLGDRRLSLSDLSTFAQGDAIHDLLKDRARRGGPNLIWGKWSCKCESLFHHEPCTYGEIDQTEECPHCHTKVDRYHEVSMFDEELWIVGNPDVIFYFANIDAYFINELKSISPEQFKDLVRPKPEHVLQVVFYWFLMNRLGYRLVDKVSIFYQTKGYVFSGPTYKEFVIDPQAELHRLEDMIQTAREHKRSILSIEASKQEPKSKRAGVRRKPASTTVYLPPRVHCASQGSKDAKTCEVCTECFEIEL